MYNPIEKFTEQEKDVLGMMQDEIGNNYATLENATKIPNKILKKIIKMLKENSMIQIVSFIDPDGDRQGYLGRGWVLTRSGELAQNRLEEKHFRNRLKEEQYD